ncbi:MAG: Uma2 family endonuclease [Bacteroidota bacterium]
MGYALEKQQRLTLQEYEALEAQATDIRYEFFEGIVYAMAGATTVHNQIVGNAAYHLRDFYRPKGCRVFIESVKLEVLEGKRYVYPDVLVSCNQRDKDDIHIIRDPVLIIEVLSDSTEKKDLKEKVEYYQELPSLQAYLIVEQTECWIRVYERDAQGNWLPHWFANNLSDTLTLRSGWSIPLSELYDDVELNQFLSSS